MSLGIIGVSTCTTIQNHALLLLKTVSMIRKYHNHKPQTTPLHREEEPLNHHKTPGGQIKQSNQLYLPHQDNCNTRMDIKVRKRTKIRNRYNQVPHLTQDTNGKVTNSQLDATNESQEISPFPAGDHKAHINRHAQMHSKHKTEKKDP